MHGWAVGGSLWRQWTQTNDGNQAATRESSLAMPTSLINKSQRKLLPTLFLTLLGRRGMLRAQNDPEELCVASQEHTLETSNTSLVLHLILRQGGKGAFELKY